MSVFIYLPSVPSLEPSRPSNSPPSFCAKKNNNKNHKTKNYSMRISSRFIKALSDWNLRFIKKTDRNWENRNGEELGAHISRTVWSMTFMKSMVIDGSAREIWRKFWKERNGDLVWIWIDEDRSEWIGSKCLKCENEMKWNRIEMFKLVVLVYIKYMNYKGAERESTFLSEDVTKGEKMAFGFG